MTLEKILPIRGYLLIEPVKSETEITAESAGLALPDTFQNSDLPQEGSVLKVGDMWITEQGAKITSPVEEGDRIIFKKWGGSEIKIDNRSYYFVRFDDVLGTC